jgi:hypothetical protein
MAGSGSGFAPAPDSPFVASRRGVFNPRSLIERPSSTQKALESISLNYSEHLLFTGAVDAHRRGLGFQNACG